jgi:HEAT repeat protein
MNQVLSWLAGSDLRSDGPANEVAEFVLENPEAFEDLYAGLSETDDVVRGRTADTLEKVSRSKPELVREHLPEMSYLARQEQLPVVKMHLAMIFGHLAIYPELVEQLMNMLLHQLKDESVFTRSWAIASLCIIARKYPEECQIALDQLIPLQGDNSIAIRSRVKKAINLLTDPGAKFPKGWIKSEYLQGI